MNDEEIDSLLERIDNIEKAEIAEAMYELGQERNISAGIKLAKKRDEIQSENDFRKDQSALSNDISSSICRLVVWLLETTNSTAVVRDSDFISDFDGQIMSFLGLKSGWGCIDRGTDTIIYEVEHGLLDTLFGTIFESIRFKFDDCYFDSNKETVTPDDIISVYLALTDNTKLNSNIPALATIASTLDILDNFWRRRNNEILPLNLAIGLIRAALWSGGKNTYEEFVQAVGTANISGTESGSLDIIYELIE
jgi:hypothetical protein